MKTGLRAITFLALGILLMAPLCWAGSTDAYLKDLKSSDPEIRANAAYELGCG
jgi:hypothetical protein